jgi:anti-sigma factor RsiW
MKANDMDTDPMAELPANIKQHMTRYKAPPGLERRIRHMLAQETRGPSLLDRLRANARQWLPVGVSFACGLLVAVSVVTYRGDPRGEADVERQVVSAHVRSLLADHLMDVASTDQHTVKPWFTGKLDFAPPVIDLAATGFPLVGGRLDYLNDRAVAALVYRRRGHVINVFVMPAPDARPIAAVATTHQGFHISEWQSGGMRFWAVSDLAREELAAFAQAMRAAD